MLGHGVLYVLVYRTPWLGPTSKGREDKGSGVEGGKGSERGGKGEERKGEREGEGKGRRGL